MTQSLNSILDGFNDMNPEHAESLINFLQVNSSVSDPRCIEPLVGIIAHSGRDPKTGAEGNFVEAATALLADRFPVEAVKVLAGALSEVAGVAVRYREISSLGELTDLVLSVGSRDRGMSA